MQRPIFSASLGWGGGEGGYTGYTFQYHFHPVTQLLGGSSKAIYSKFHMPSTSLSISNIDGLLVINFIFNHHSHKKDLLLVSR